MGVFFYVITSVTNNTNMPNPNALWEDMSKLDTLYEELGWSHEDQLTFKVVKPENGCAYIAVENLTQCVNGFLK